MMESVSDHARTFSSSTLAPWEVKAHQLISAMCFASWRQANPPGRKRHRPYSVPALAQELVTCLGRNDEVGAKAIFLAYDGIAQEYKQ